MHIGLGINNCQIQNHYKNDHSSTAALSSSHIDILENPFESISSTTMLNNKPYGDKVMKHCGYVVITAIEIVMYWSLAC
jgi:hypothetical protein